MSWYVLYVKSRYEIKAASNLEKMGIQTFCPVVKEVRQWSDRKKMIVRPLFNSYVFIKIKEENREQVFEVTGIVRYIYWLGKPAMVHDKEINTIKDWVEAGLTHKMEVRGLSPGNQIKIKSGLFKDQDARILDIGKHKMRLVLFSLGCTVTVNVSDQGDFLIKDEEIGKK